MHNKNNTITAYFICQLSDKSLTNYNRGSLEIVGDGGGAQKPKFLKVGMKFIYMHMEWRGPGAANQELF